MRHVGNAASLYPLKLASYFNLNMLSIHEIGSLKLSQFLISSGRPALNVMNELAPKSYSNDLISTFIENDIVATS